MTSIVTNPILRERAKNTVHRNLGRLIVMELIFAALILAAILLPFLLFMSNIKAAIVNYRFAQISSYVGDELPALLPLAAPALLSVLLVYLLSPLSMGLYKAHIDMARGLQPSYGTLFCRFRNILGCVGLSLWITLKLLLWTLPGIGASLLMGILGIMFDSDFIVAITPLVTMVVTLVCLIPASYRYHMANYIFADDPSVGVFGAVDKSKGMMQHRKWQLFKLTFVYGLIDGLVSYVVDLITKALGTSAGTAAAIVITVLTLISLAVTVYLDFRASLCDAHFYEEYKY